MPRRVWWRGWAVRVPLVRSFKEPERRAEIWPTESTPVLAAASSMASGTPSSLRQMSATSRAFSGPIPNPGLRARARSAKSLAASEWASSSASLSRPSSGKESDGTRHTTSPPVRSASRLVARTRSPGHEESNPSARRAAASTTCSQLSRTSKSLFDRRWLASVSASGRPGCSRTPSAAAVAWGASSGSGSRASSTIQAPSG